MPSVRATGAGWEWGGPGSGWAGSPRTAPPPPPPLQVRQELTNRRTWPPRKSRLLWWGARFCGPERAPAHRVVRGVCEHRVQTRPGTRGPAFQPLISDSVPTVPGKGLKRNKQQNAVVGLLAGGFVRVQPAGLNRGSLAQSTLITTFNSKTEQKKRRGKGSRNKAWRRAVVRTALSPWGRARPQSTGASASCPPGRPCPPRAPEGTWETPPEARTGRSPPDALSA